MTDQQQHLLGFDIGGTKCAVVIGASSDDGRLAIVDRTAVPTNLRQRPETIIAELAQIAESRLADLSLTKSQLSAIGISCGGPLDSRRGLILGPSNLPGWDHVPVVEQLHAAFSSPVFLQNDADACALAEWRWGAGQGYRNMIFLTFGTGMGAGLILNGALYSGSNGLAGEVGHIRLAEDGPLGQGKRGSFEGFCSGGGIARLARLVYAAKQPDSSGSAGDGPAVLESVTAQDLAVAARQGDETALEIWRIVGERLGAALAILVDTFDPDAIVIGSIFERCRDLLWPHAHQVLQREALKFEDRNCRIIPAELGDKIGDYACLAVAQQSVCTSRYTVDTLGATLT